ncbi:DUF4192 domain-containing protein [Dietzia sp. UBA5065]|jgi:hypothetical protein|uniref:DUF4192 domain-containing protein n=1 Tax=Dietzia sp. UBA5065 TaxID=1946422 RepID=UPI0025C1B499|nr:DUF4192 domain-containing protein [Dietzia sp. UBA5065]HMT49996.1 DUF4192 domain-containing protein [Dietzia sp.]
MTHDGRGRGDGPEDGDGRTTVVISSPEELIASIPAMLGFPPGAGSVVVVCGRTSDGRQGPVVRMDVDGLLDGSAAYSAGDHDDPDVEHDLPAATIGEGPARGLAQFCSREGVTAVHLVVVHEDCVDGYSAGLRAEDAAAAFEYWLGLAGTRVVTAYGVPEFAAGAPWVDLFGMVRGVQLDPGTTEIAAVHAFDGRVQAGSREEIERLYLARDADACDRDPGAGDADSQAGSLPVESGVDAHDRAAERLEAGEELDDDELAEVGRALLDIGVRDEIYRRLAQRGLVDDDGRRLLWWALARRRPGRERSVSLMMLGAAAYFSGSGVHARSALEAAVGADERNSLARLLLHGLENGLAPERLRRVAAAA